MRCMFFLVQSDIYRVGTGITTLVLYWGRFSFVVRKIQFYSEILETEYLRITLFNQLVNHYINALCSGPRFMLHNPHHGYGGLTLANGTPYWRPQPLQGLVTTSLLLIMHHAQGSAGFQCALCTTVISIAIVKVIHDFSRPDELSPCRQCIPNGSVIVHI